MPRRLGRALKDIKPEDRKNPKSIRRLLHQWICSEHDRDVEQATRHVNASRPPKGTRESKRHPVSNDAYYHVINDDTHLQYYQIEAVARHHNVPIAALLLFTRAQSEIARGGYAEARDLLTAFTGFVAGLSAMVEGHAAQPVQEPESRVEFLDYPLFKALAEANFSAVPAGDKSAKPDPQ